MGLWLQQNYLSPMRQTSMQRLLGILVYPFSNLFLPFSNLVPIDMSKEKEYQQSVYQQAQSQMPLAGQVHDSIEQGRH
jgi:hypothetical protein